MIDHIMKTAATAFAITTGVFTFVPESFFEKKEWFSQSLLEHVKLADPLNVEMVNVIVSRIACFTIIWAVVALIYVIFLNVRWCTTIKGDNYAIRIEYGNILKKKKTKHVISFDECFTTQVGSATADINPDSICGQYLSRNPDINIKQLIIDAGISPSRRKSKYQNEVCYPSGTIVPNGNDLLLAFAKLDERGKGRFFTRDEYIECLNLLWSEIERNYSEMDVCIPILGAGTTVFESGAGASISQQNLLNMMIWSYKLSSHKIKAPHRLRIVCRRNSDFSINKIEK